MNLGNAQGGTSSADVSQGEGREPESEQMTDRELWERIEKSSSIRNRKKQGNGRKQESHSVWGSAGLTQGTE